ncbi:amidohydrolase family protein [Lutimonas halocynthiae]|uniref:amidohydrolase n=1 Tax=Lutimonas halocynthiae TaxID=1446477 RepID=UPI0025B5EABB|nr:amidohydrolase family protein [Lutimonas halocynthiae]MDN3641417.1 amidohydrolase family protein [Lutimonas halocynthiae]
MKKIQLILSVLVITLLIGCKSETKQEAADMVFTNGNVITVDEEQPSAEAVAIKDNKIVFVGSSEDAKAYIGEGTETTDLAGKTMMPGFVSGHDHIIASQWTKQGLDLNGATNKEETYALIKKYVADNPDMEYYTGMGYNKTLMGGFPTAKELDELIPDKVAIFLDFTIHDAWLNSEAMKAGGITKDSPDDVPGVTYWVRDTAGTPSGVGVELAWFPTYAKVMWNPEKMIEDSREFLHSNAIAAGYTTMLTPGLVTPNFSNTEGMFDDLEITMQILTKLDNEGKLGIRSFVQPAYKDANSDPIEFSKRVKEFADKYNGDHLRVHGIKIHPEGTWSSGGVLMVEPWEGTDDYGASATSPDRMKEVLLAANPLGLDVFTHVEGSGSVAGKIDAILASREAGNTDERNALHHFQIATPADLQRTIDHNIPVNVTPIFSTDWASQDKDYLRMLGKERTSTHVARYADVIGAGNKVSISSDIPSSPVESVGALTQIQTAVTFRNPLDFENSKKFPADAKTLTVAQAIQAVTINPAWQIRMEDKIGSIEVGKYADFVILEASPYEVDETKIKDIKVIGTIMDGKYTYKSDDKQAVLKTHPKHFVPIPAALKGCNHGSHL